MKYIYVRFRWWDPVDLEEVSRELGEEYEVEGEEKGVRLLGRA